MRFYTEIGRFCVFETPLGNLGATYDDHLRLIGKRVLDFLLALIERFSLGVTAEELRAIIGWKSAIFLQWGPLDPKFQVDRVAPSNHSSSQKTRINVLSYGIKIWTDLSTVLSQFTHVTDGRTDGQTDRQTDSENSHRFTLTLSLGMILCQYPDELYFFRNYKDGPLRCWKPHDCVFIRLNTIPERVRMTDRQNCSSLYSAQHCEQMRTRCKKVFRSVLYTYVLSISSVDDGPSDQSVTPASHRVSSTNTNSLRTTQWMTVAQHSRTCRACMNGGRHRSYSQSNKASRTSSSAPPQSSPTADHSASTVKHHNIQSISTIYKHGKIFSKYLFLKSRQMKLLTYEVHHITRFINPRWLQPKT